MGICGNRADEMTGKKSWIKEKFQKNVPAICKIGLAFLITAVYFLAVWKWIGFSYAINDDINMRDIASGAYTGTPDGHLIFMLYPMGFVLKSLYQIWPGIEWYGVMMVGCYMLSMWVMLSGILLYDRKRKNRKSTNGFVTPFADCILVRVMGLEPIRQRHTPLKRACLPIPAHSHFCIYS